MTQTFNIPSQSEDSPNLSFTLLSLLISQEILFLLKNFLFTPLLLRTRVTDSLTASNRPFITFCFRDVQIISLHQTGNRIHHDSIVPQDPKDQIKSHPSTFFPVLQWTLFKRIPHQNSIFITCLAHISHMPSPLQLGYGLNDRGS
jgi:hypothetical protein